MNDVTKELYEKLYFHEIESREKINGRLQIPLAIIMSMFAMIGFMLQNLDKSIWSFASLMFYLFFGLSFASIGTSVYFFIRSWYGNTYSFLPSAAETDNYRKQLIETYANTPNGHKIASDYLDQFITDCFIKCSTVNTHCNDKRSIYLHKTNTFIIATGISAFLAFIMFYSFDLNKKEEKKPITDQTRISECKEKCNSAVNISLHLHDGFKSNISTGEENDIPQKSTSESSTTSESSAASSTATSSETSKPSSN